MKNRKIVKNSITVLAPLVLTFGVFIGIKSSNLVEKVDGYSSESSLPTTIDLNDTSASNIRSYYSSLNSLSTSERQGTNLLKNLKTILKNDQKYYSYDSGNYVWQIYEISDRDWDLSPASAITYGSYNSSTKIISNYEYGSNSSPKNDPYVHSLYTNRNVTNQAKAWGDHTQTNWGINREHVWPKAEGFDGKDTSDDAGARGDPMHLMAGNGYANNIHSNYFYGYVDTSNSYTNCGTKYSYTAGNLLGKSKTVGGSINVFEPQDSDKGDIARAIFYMVARYNYLSGSDSDGINSNNPNLILTQNLSDYSSSSYHSSTSTTGKMGILTDLLHWHHADPVDEFEIHRNNLLFTNFTNNRNPFIDFPEWVDYIWGTANYTGSTYDSYNSTPTGYAIPSSDTINGYNSSGTVVDVDGVTLNKNSTTLGVGFTETLVASVSPDDATDKEIIWTSSNSNIASVSSNGVVTGVADGTAIITATSHADNSKKATCTIKVTSADIPVTSVTLDETEISLDIGGKQTLSATVLPVQATNKNIVWSSNNNTVATVENGLIKAVSSGTAVITASSESDSSKKATCTVTVNEHVTLSHTNSPFESTEGEASPDPVQIGGVEYQNAYGLIYNNDSLEFTKNTNAFLGNTTAYGKSISKVVLNWYSYNNSNLISVYEGNTSLPSTTTVTASNSGLVSTYNFTGTNNKFFKIKVTGTNYYLRFSSIEIYFNNSTSGLVATNYKLVTDAADLRTGDKVIFAGIRQNVYYTATAKNTNYLNSEESLYEDGYIDISSSTTPYIVTRNNSLFNFFNGTKYMSSGSSSYTYFYEETNVSNNSTFSVSINATNGKSTVISQGNYNNKYFRFNSSSNNLFFGMYSSSTTNSDVYIYKQTIQVLADAWSQTFLDNTSDGTTCTVSNWASLSSSYKALDSSVRTEIAEVEANASTDYSKRAQAMARYDYFMGDSRFNNVEHFITGRSSSLSARPINQFVNENNNVTVLVIIVSVISVSSLGCLCVIKKKKAGLR